MKVLELGDLHLGIKKDDPWHQSISLSLIKQAIAYSLEHNIKRWIQTGDWFDVRQATTQTTMEFIRVEIVPLLIEAGIHVDIIVGNHDIQFKNTIQPNAPRELLSEYPCFTVHDEPTTVDFDGYTVDMIPWMCESNTSKILEFIRNSQSMYCVGHFELTGFYYYKNVKSEGLARDFLERYQRVISGHYHTQSDGSNVKYIGTPYTITSGDENEERGFWIHDLANDVMDFVPNNKMYHVRLDYPGQIDPSKYENCSVRLFAHEIDEGLTKLEHELAKVVHSLKTVNQAVLVETDTESYDMTQQPTAVDLMVESLMASDLSDDDIQESIKMVRALYSEALTLK